MGIELLVSVVIFIVIVAVLFWLIRYLNLPEMVYKIAVVAVVIAALIWLLQTLGVFV